MDESCAPVPGTRSTSNAGRTTPDTFSCFALTLNDADLACSCTRYEMSPVAYVTSASEKDASCITRPILRFAYRDTKQQSTAVQRSQFQIV